MKYEELNQYLIEQRNLTKREAEIADLVVQALSNMEISNILYITEKSVRFHLENIYRKMEIKTRAELIVDCLPRMKKLI